MSTLTVQTRIDHYPTWMDFREAVAEALSSVYGYDRTRTSVALETCDALREEARTAFLAGSPVRWTADRLAFRFEDVLCWGCD